jgi:hypothetical protein
MEYTSTQDIPVLGATQEFLAKLASNRQNGGVWLFHAFQASPFVGKNIGGG